MTLGIFARVFLASVFLASAWNKRDGRWPARLAGFGLWPDGRASIIARIVGVGEVAIAVSLLLTNALGLVLAGIAFLAFASVLMSARWIGFRGSCGCSETGRVSWIAAVRCIGWGAFALVLGFSEYAADADDVLRLSAFVIASDVVAGFAFLWLTSQRIRVELKTGSRRLLSGSGQPRGSTTSLARANSSRDPGQFT